MFTVQNDFQMKNRPTPYTKKKSFYSRHPIRTLVASGLGLIGVGSLLLLTFFVSTNSIRQQQDLQGEASVTQGDVVISQSHNPATPQLGQVNYFTLQANTHTTKLSELTLFFDVITDTESEITVQETSPLLTYKIEKKDVKHGYKVEVTATSKVEGGYVTGDTASDILKISYTPTKPGSVTLNFDREKSRAIVFESNPPKDQLTHLPVFSVYVPGENPPTATPLPEDFSLTDDNLDSTFTFFETTGSRNQVDKQRLVKDRTYTVRHQTKVTNINKDNLITIDPVVLTELKINNTESVTRTFRRPDLNRISGPLEIQFEQTFKAKDVNTFVVTVDSTNVFPEIKEDNNTISVSYSSSTTAKACDANCSSNADCADDHRCYDTGSGDKRCRLNTNLTSTSCSHPTGGPNYSCNQYCANTAECAAGFSCWNNYCRNPYNVESPTCVNPSTRQSELIRESCNKTCSANRDCANNMRCFNGSCRLATNPSSTSCSAAVIPTTTAPPKGGTIATPTPNPAATVRPIATIRPTATPSATLAPSPTATATAIPAPVATIQPTPSPTAATPTPQPEPAPEESVLDSFFSRVTSFFNSLFNSTSALSGTVLTGAWLPLAVIAAGILLLIIAIFVALRPSRKARPVTAVPTVPVSPPPAKPELHAKPNPPPPPIPGHGVIQPKKSVVPAWGGKTVTTPSITKPDVIELPPEKPEVTIQPEHEVAKPLPVPSAPPLPPSQPIAPTQTVTAATPVSSTVSQTTSAPTATQPQGGAAQSMLQRLKQKGITIPEKKTTE